MAAPTRRTETVGVFITPEAIYGVRARCGGGPAEVIAHAAVEVPPGVFDGGTVESPQRLGFALRALWRKAGFKERRACVALYPASYSMRALRFPDLSRRERRDVVRGELEQASALSLGSESFDYIWISGTDGGAAGAQADAYAYYTTEAAADGIRQAVRQASLQLDGLEPASTSMMRAYLAGQGQQRPAALLCPSERHCDLCIHDGVSLRHLRRIPAGRADIQELARETARRTLEARQVSGDAAPLGGGASERGRQDPNLGAPLATWTPEDEEREREPSTWLETAFPDAPPPDAENNAALDDSDSAMLTGSQLAGRVRAHSQTSPQTSFLVAEVSRSLAFYAREQRDAPQPEALVVVGPPDLAAAVHEILSGTQTVPVELADPERLFRLSPATLPESVEGRLDGYLPALGAACGAAGVEAGIPRTDIAWAARAAPTAGGRKVVLTAMTATAAWMVASILLAALLKLPEQSVQGRVTDLKGQIAALQQQRAPALRHQELSQAARAQQAKSQIPAAAILGRVAAVWAPGVALTNLNASSGKVTLEGQAASVYAVERFALLVGQGQSIRQPVIESVREGGDGRLTFRLVGTASAGAAPAAAPAAGGGS